jgi:hypothetical protein
LSKKQVEVEQILKKVAELRNFAVRSRWPLEEFFAVCMMSSASMVKPGHDEKVIKAFRALIRNTRTEGLFRNATQEEAERLAFEKMYG